MKNNYIFLILIISLLVLSACEYNGMAILSQPMILLQDYEHKIELPTEINLKSLKLSGRVIGDGDVFAYLNVNNEMYKILDSNNLEYQEFKDVCENTCELDVSSSQFSIVFLIEDAELVLQGIDYELQEEKETKYQQKEVTIQGNVEINKPVQYKKIINLEEEQSTIKVQLDNSATNVVVKDVQKNTEVSPQNIKLEKKDTSLSTGEKLKSFFSGSPTGFAVFTQPPQENIELNINQKTKAIEVEYFLPGPTAQEKIISGTNKQIIISSDIHYQDILTFTEIPEVPLESINLYWVQKNGEKIIQQFKAFDFNDNNLVDYIEWITPHLSTQTYEVEINILNVQSYPSIGGTWTVEFTTAGQKDLIITGEDGTKFEQDIKHMFLKCGEKEVDPFYDGNSVIYPDYQCDEISYHIVEVITKGKHTQKFTFGNLYEYAHNLASNVPDTLNIQGQLTNSSDDLQNGSFEFTFKLYTVATGGSAIWEENQTLTVNNGIYDAVLGTVTEISLDFSEQYYLGMAVGGDSEMTPRINISSTPYSQRSKFADSLDCTDCVNQSHIQDSSINSSFLQADIIDGTELADTITLDANMDITGGYDFAVDTDTLFVNASSGNVGIGTTSQFGASGDEAKLFIQQNDAGKVGVDIDYPQSTNSLPSTYPQLVVRNTDNTNGNWARISFNDAGTSKAAATMGAEFTDHTNDYGEYVFWTRGSQGWGERMRIDSIGNVGIGTEDPSDELQIGSLTSNQSNFLSIKSEGNDEGEWLDGIKLRSHTENYGFTIQYDARIATSNKGLDILRHNNDESGTTALFISRNNGDIGIGTASPGSELDVNGTIRTVEICDETGSNCKDISTGWATDTDTWWGLNSGYIYNNSNSLDFNETKLNATIDARDSDTTYSAGSGLDLGGTEFSHTDTSSQATSDNSGRTYIQDITLDTYGHITGLATATETVTDTNTNANTECSGSTTYLDGEGNCDTLDGLEDFETATDDGVAVGSGSAFVTKVIPDCDDSSGNHLNYDTTTNTFSCGTSGDGYEADTDTQLSQEQVQDYAGAMAGSHLTYTDGSDDLSVDDDYLLNTGDTGSGHYNFTGYISVENNVSIGGGGGYISGDAQEITLHSPVSNNLLRIRDARIQSTTTFRADNYESGDGSQGITDTSTYYLCKSFASHVCQAYCQVIIKDGLIVDCTGTFA